MTTCSMRCASGARRRRRAGRLRQRYAGIADRVSLSVPYRIAPATLAELVAAFRQA